jgi:cytochrome c peroxidase
MKTFLPALLIAFPLLSGPCRAAEEPKPPQPGEIKEALKKIGFGPTVRADAKTSAKEISLGRQLFSDPRLSGNNTMSCMSCHHPGMAWTDGLPRAAGPAGGKPRRNTPTLFNTRHNPSLFWDGRAENLQALVLDPIRNPSEMAQDIDSLMLELNRLSGYSNRFLEAYGISGITPENIAKALAAFVGTLDSPPDHPLSKFQKGGRNLPIPAQRGLLVFAGKGRCAECHSGPLLTDHSFHNIGLKDEDPGRHAVAPLKNTRGAFKTPSLLETARTAPYMHDGRAKTLEEVVDLYDRGGDPVEDRSPLIQPLHLSPQEKEDLTAFLRALSSPPASFDVPPLPEPDAPHSLKEVMHVNNVRLKLIESILDRGDPAWVRLHAETLRENAVNILKFSPAGLGDSESFRLHAETLEKEASLLAAQALAPASTRKDVSASFERVKASCAACHADFRPSDREIAGSSR